MRSIRLVACAASLMAALSSAAQQQLSPFGEVFEVRVTSVDVVVTGKDGQPVTGLRPGDFEVYENGKPQPISHFAEYGTERSSSIIVTEGGAAPVEVETTQAGRRFIFYFDDSTLDLGNRHAVFPAIRKFLATNLRAGDQAMVVSWNRELHIRVPWTADLAAVDAALAKLAAEAPSGSVIRTEKLRAMKLMSRMAAEANEAGNSILRPVWDEVEEAARSYAEAFRLDVERSTGTLAKLLASLSGAEGKKVLVIATQSLPTLAGGEVFEHMEALRVQATSSLDSNLRPGALRGSRIVDISRYNVQPALDTLARAANAAGVAIYSLSPKGLAGSPSGNVELEASQDVSIDFAESLQALSGVNLLAARTGGVAMIGAPADVALARLGRDLGTYYSLGYRSKPGDVAERKIEVRAKRPGLKVRAREHVYYRSLEREMADRVMAHHLEREVPNALGVSLQATAVTTTGSQQLLPVMVVIPVDELTLLPDGRGGVVGGFSVYTCTGDGEGSTSGVNVQTQTVRFTAEQAEQMKGRRIGFAIQVPMEKNRDQVSIGVVDHNSQEQGFATLK